jgi:hypothetical protein
MNAIITAATGYSESHLQIFLWSIAKNCKNTTVFMIVYREDQDSLERLKSKYPFIEPVYINASIRKQFGRLADHRTRPYLNWLTHQLSKIKYSSIISILRPIGLMGMRIIHERFFIARQILESHPNVFSNVLLTDCRDVVIQQDPFELLSDKLVSGLEPEIIRNETYTSAWIETAYGQDILSELLDKPVICAGVTLGPTQEVKKYLTEMCNEMWRQLPRILFQDYGYDQAAHIYLSAENQIQLELTNNHQGLITTAGLEPLDQMNIDFAKELVKVGDRYPAIIHQYDRHPDMLSFFRKLSTKATATAELRTS